MRLIIIIGLLISLLMVSSVVTAAPEESKGMVTKVIDGNTFEVQDVGTVRLADVICPDIGTQEGLAAKAFSEASLLNKLIYLDLDDKSGRDQGGRIICVAYLAGSDNALDVSKNFNKMIVNSGYAKVWDFTNNEFNPADWWGGAIPVGVLKTPDRLLKVSQQSGTDNHEIDESTRDTQQRPQAARPRVANFNCVQAPTWHSAVIYKGDLQQTGCFGERSYALWPKSDGGLHFVFTLEDEGCQREYWTKPGIIKTNTWNHIKVHLNTKEEKVEIFVNGTKIYIEEQPRFIRTPMDSKPIKKGDSPLKIGGMFKSASDQSNFLGSIDEVKITGNSTSDLRGYWNFDENSGTSTKDSSRYGRNGVVNNAVWVEGTSGSALQFRGNDDSYVEVMNAPQLTPETELTLEIDIKPEYCMDQ